MRYGFQSEFFFPKSIRLLLRRLPTKWFPAALIITSFAGTYFLTSSTTTRAQQSDAWQMGSASRVQRSRGPSKINSGPRAVNWSSDQSLRKSGVSTAEAPNANGGFDQYVVLNVEFTTATARLAFRQRGATVFTAIDRFADMFVADDKVWDAINKRTDVVWTELIGVASAPPKPRPERATPTRQAPERIVRGGLNGVTGRGVAIAIIDSGIDFRNPDFVTYDPQARPTSRLLYLWDTTSDAFDRSGKGSKPPFTYPNGASLGTLYTRAQLTADLRSTVKHIPSTDLNGHGTACAGIAAGNGNNDRGTNGMQRTETIGVAPDADLIGIRIGKGEDAPENSYLLNAAVGWLDKAVGTMPLVVSYSLGGHKGGHDGELIAERELNARFPHRIRSRAIVAAAGNEATEDFHSEVTFWGKNAATLVRWQTPEDNYLDLYLNSGDDDILIAPAGKTQLEIAGGWTNPFTHQFVATVKVKAGGGGLWLYNDSGKKNTAHIYMEDATFSSDVVSYNTLVGTPGTADNVLTIGSYDWNDSFDLSTGQFSLHDACGFKKPLSVGSLSCYSSPGYSRNGTIKPEIAAPGEWFTASYAKTTDGSGVGTDWIVDRTGNLVAMNGTSAATPYTAGIIALMFQKRPGLTFGEIRRLLITSASSSDLVTGPVPNPNWGYGKLDYVATEKIISGLGK
jgi:subtilisin family serine protease